MRRPKWLSAPLKHHTAKSSSKCARTGRAGPRAVQAVLAVDEGMGISNRSSNATWLVHEVYPREEEGGRQTPVGLWQHGQRVGVSVRGHVQVLRLTRVDATARASRQPQSQSKSRISDVPLYLLCECILNCVG